MAKAGHKNTIKQTKADPSLLDLPRASERLKIDPNNVGKFEIPFEKEYDRKEGSKGDTRTPLKTPLSNFDADEFLDYVRKDAKAKDRKRAAEGLMKSEPNLFAAFQRSKAKVPSDADENLPLVAPVLWAERTTGRAVSPADFIRQHYAPWLGQGLTRGNLKVLDIQLYNAYVAQTRRSPDHALKELPFQERPKALSPEDALERRRASQRQNYHLSKK